MFSFKAKTLREPERPYKYKVRGIEIPRQGYVAPVDSEVADAVDQVNSRYGCTFRDAVALMQDGAPEQKALFLAVQGISE